MDLIQALDVLWRRRAVVIAIFIIGVAAGAAAFFLLPHEYEAKSSVLIVNTTVGRDPSMSNLDMPSFLESSSVLSRVKQQLGLDQTLDGMRKQIDATVDLNSNLMPIAYRDRDPQVAVKVANGLADVLAQFYRQVSASRFDELSSYLNTELGRQQGKLDDLDRKLQLAISKDPYAGQSDAAAAISTQMLTLDAQRAQLNATLMGHEAQADMAQRRLTQVLPIAQHEVLQSDPAYQNLAAQVAKDQTQLDLDRAQFTARYPGLPGLDEQVQSEKNALAQTAQATASGTPAASATYAAALAAKDQIDGTVAGDRAQLDAVNAQIAQAQGDLDQMPSTGVEIATLRRQRDAAEASYQWLFQQRTATLAQQAEAATIGSVVVVDRAVDAQSVIAKHAAFLAIGAVLGFIVLGLSLPFLVEMTDRSLRTLTAIEGLYGKPVIAAVGRRFGSVA